MGYTVYVMANPYRVMIDLPQVSFALPEGAGDNTRGLVTQYRYGPVDRAQRSPSAADTANNDDP